MAILMWPLLSHSTNVYCMHVMINTVIVTELYNHEGQTHALPF